MPNSSTGSLECSVISISLQCSKVVLCMCSRQSLSSKAAIRCEAVPWLTKTGAALRLLHTGALSHTHSPAQAEGVLGLTLEGPGVVQSEMGPL